MLHPWSWSAGLGTAVELVKHGVTNVLVIDRNTVVGGLARTEVFGNARFDVGPHRFFTKNVEINKLWHDTLGSDFRPVDRLTRIYHKQKFFHYPIKPFDVVSKLGIVESTHALLSFASARFTRKRAALTFEDWITDRFGRKLYDTFFKTYTEKVWGIPGHQIGAEWAAQRIKGLDIVKVLKDSLLGGSGGTVKTLVDRFDYPVLGAGQMYEVMTEQTARAGVEYLLGASVVSVNRANDRIASVDVRTGDGEQVRIQARHFFSSLPMTHFVRMLEPTESEEVMKAAEALYYREHVTVDLLVSGRSPFPDQWIYVHSPDVQMARIANYNNFSPSMSSAPDRTALSVEYFTFQHEELWKRPDGELVELGGGGAGAAEAALTQPDRRGVGGAGVGELPHLLHGIPRAVRDPEAPAQRAPEPVGDRPRGHVQVQQSGSFGLQRTARGPELSQAAGGPLQSVEYQHRRRVSGERGTSGILKPDG